MMEIVKILNYKKMDAFAKKGSEGNPAGYIRLEENQSLAEQEMLQISREQKGFVYEVER